jgi:multidrug efflux system membrane fusion protein
MNIDHNRSDFQRAATVEQPTGLWGGFRRWSGNHPFMARVLWFAVGLSLLALLIWTIKPKPTVRTGFNMGPQPVGVARAQEGDIRVTLNALGTVTPLSTATLRPQVSGMLVKINFTEGHMVKVGEVLAQIDPRPYQASLDQALGQLARDQATLANARTDLARYEMLAQQNAISQQQLATQAALVRSSAGLVAADQANVDTARINLGFTKIVSPVAGRVGVRQVDVGNIVTANQATGIVVVTQLQPMSVLFTIPEDSVRQVVARVNSGATLTVEAYDRSQTVKLATGTLAAVDNVVDPTTGSVKLRALFDNQDGKLFPAQFVNVRLLVDTQQNQTVVPLAAIQRGADGNFVFLVTPEKTVSQRTVKLGTQDSDKVAILQGVKPGDTVVVDGADRLRDGADVEVPDLKGQIAAPSSSGSPQADAARAAQRAQLVAAVNTACSADIAKLCNGAAPGSREARLCLFQNRDSLSEGCAQATARMRRGAGGRGPRGGGGPR